MTESFTSAKLKIHWSMKRIDDLKAIIKEHMQKRPYKIVCEKKN